MMHIDLYMEGDGLAINVQPEQAKFFEALGGSQYCEVMAARGEAWSAYLIDENSNMSFKWVGGYALGHPGYATIWALFAENIGAGMLAIVRHVKRELAKLDLARIDALIDGRHEAAVRFIKMVGFVHEGALARALPDGGDAHVYVMPPRDRGGE